MDSENIVYQEKKSSWSIIVSLLIASAFFMFAFIYQSILKLGEIGNNPAPGWVHLCISIICVTCFYAFKTLKVKITTEKIIVGFNNLFIKKIKFEDIEKIEIDNNSYGGYGIRMRFVKGKIRIAYNVGQPRVVISIKNKRKEFTFSTNNPDKVIKLIKSKIKR